MVNFKEDERLNKLNHSCAHLMAQAVKHLFPEAKFWVGPVVETGFYYDIDLGDKVINDEDIEKISKEMKKLAKDGKRSLFDINEWNFFCYFYFIRRHAALWLRRLFICDKIE